jgi:hypothetical protein
MPYLSDKDREEQRQRTKRHCDNCRQDVWMEYCAQCDVFFEFNHNAGCRRFDESHGQHRLGFRFQLPR